MNRQQKELVVQLFRERFSESPATFIVGYKGLTVNQMQELRSKLRAHGGALKVAKARLMKLAVGDLEDTQALMPHFKDQIGVVFASDESPAVAKVLSDFAKDNEALRLVIGSINGTLVDQSAIVRIASLPSKEVLLAKLCGTLKAPMQRMVSTLNMQVVQLLLVLKQVAESKK
jgi:large subunit ribosomal protein L10